jgi:protein phosphatase 2C family protein 2/3
LTLSLLLQESDGDTDMEDGEVKSDKSETPPPALSPETRANDSKAQEQLKSQPQGDEASDAVKAEGLMDTSDSPFKA